MKKVNPLYLDKVRGGFKADKTTVRKKPSDKVHLGHTARKRFGQNFLVDNSVISNIVAAINPQPQDFLIEIGPGLGALTEPVVSLANHLTVIELDRNLAQRLQNTPKLSDKLTVISEDALSFDFSKLISKPAKVFGNLPYNVATPLILKLFEYSSLISEMHFMLQKEVVDRIIATPNSKSYGRLSIICQYYCQVMPILEVPASSFKPAPKVESAVVRLIPKDQELLITDGTKLAQVTFLAFAQRRKTFKNSIASLHLEEQHWQDLELMGIKPQDRAEVISVAQYIELTNYLIAQGKI